MIYRLYGELAEEVYYLDFNKINFQYLLSVFLPWYDLWSLVFHLKSTQGAFEKKNKQHVSY